MKPFLGFQVFVQNRVGRKGVPATASFEAWVRAALRGRHRGRTQVNIVLFDEAEARALNRRYRGQDYATNILSFPYEPLRGEKTGLLGDLAICAPVVSREATQQAKVPRHHYAHLTVHGVLHLLGYNHENAPEAEQMEELERRILAGLQIADPYV